MISMRKQRIYFNMRENFLQTNFFIFKIALFVALFFSLAGEVSAAFTTQYEFRTNTGTSRRADPFGLNTGAEFSSGMWFTASSTMSDINEVRMIVSSSNVVTDEVRLNIYETTDGSTRGDLVATSNAVEIDGNEYLGFFPNCAAFSSGTNLTDDCYNSHFQFPAAFGIASGTQYLFMLERTDTLGSPYYLVTARDIGTDTYNKMRDCTEAGTCTSVSSGGVYVLIGNNDELVNTNTRIISFLPENATTTTNPPYFELNAYIAAEDLGTIKGIRLSFHNIDQNVLIIGALSPSDIWLLDEDIETAGEFFFATSTVSVADGNYRIEACIDRTFFGDDFGLIGGWIIGAFTDVDDCQSHQFIVGTSTFIGNISQNLWRDTQDFFGNSTATSSEALAATCNPFSSTFGIRECTAFLLVPDPLQLSQTMTEARSAFLSRIPWGYFTRTIDIMASQATTTLPSFTTNIQIGAGSDMDPASTSITIDIADMVAGAGSLVDGIEAVGYEGVGFRTVFEDWIKGMVALLVILTIVADIANSHGRNEMADGNSRVGKKLS